MCAVHPEQRWPHDDCPAFGVRCPVCPPDQRIETRFASVRRLARPPEIVAGELFPCPECGQWHELSLRLDDPDIRARTTLYILCQGLQRYIGPVGRSVAPDPRAERMLAIERKRVEGHRLLRHAKHQSMRDQVHRVYRELNSGIEQLNQEIIAPSVFSSVDALLARVSERLYAIRRALELDGPAAIWTD